MNPTMKRNLSMILAALMLSASLASCGGEAPAPVSTTPVDADTVAATEAATQAPVETEPVVTTEAVTEPPVVIVYTPVVIDNFDGTKEDCTWKTNAQTKELTVENGVMSVTSTGGDPSIASKKKFDIDCSEIDAIRVRFINMTSSDAIQLFFTTDTTTNYCEQASYKEILDFTDSEPDSDEWNEVVFFTDENDLWDGTLKNIRLDLSNGEGAYIIDYISLDKVSEEVQG